MFLLILELFEYDRNQGFNHELGCLFYRYPFYKRFYYCLSQLICFYWVIYHFTACGLLIIGQVAIALL